jgi:hypothetical protein
VDEGSDCPTGKRQYATREAADAAVAAGRRQGWSSINRYRCPLCECWHTGNKFRFETSKNRTRRSKKNRRR